MGHWMSSPRHVRSPRSDDEGNTQNAVRCISALYGNPFVSRHDPAACDPAVAVADIATGSGGLCWHTMSLSVPKAKPQAMACASLSPATTMMRARNFAARINSLIR